ncbi:MAG: hypothetical protein M0Z99_02020 [Betaproteobacteria bacterium]|nr:hypothetical protein [Betaproteobacteria bacterium]
MNDMTRNPFAVAEYAPSPAGGALGQALQSREVAETQALYLMAAMNPRDPVKAMDRILNACTRPTLAEKSTYEYSRGGSDVTGPSIRLAETISQEWGNFESGFREVGRGIEPDGVGYSDVLAYAIDLQTRATKRISFRVRHWRDTKKGGYALKDERDIYELVANLASRRVRNCILSIIPGDVVEAALSQCGVTLRTKVDTSAEAVVKMVDAFAALGVSKAQIEKRIQRRLDTIQPGQIVQLRRIYASLADDMSRPEDWFEPVETAGAPQPKHQETKTTAAASKPAPKPHPGAEAAQETPRERIPTEDRPDAGAPENAAPAASASAGPTTISGLSETQERMLLQRAKDAGYDVPALLAKFGAIDLTNLNSVMKSLRSEIDEAAHG